MLILYCLSTVSLEKCNVVGNINMVQLFSVSIGFLSGTIFGTEVKINGFECRRVHELHHLLFKGCILFLSLLNFVLW